MGSAPKEVLVIGAGLIGSSIAWRLSQAGAKVLISEAGRWGGEASSAGAGMLSPGGEFDKPSPWVELGVESLRLYPSFVGELREETCLPIDFQICGSRQILSAENARRIQAFQVTAGIRAEACGEGLFYPDDALVDPTDLLRALGAACLKRGVIIQENRPVREVESTDYRALVIAAGAWSDQIVVHCGNRPVVLPPVKPIKGYLIGFDLVPGALGAMRRRGHTYVLQRANGLTIAGSTEEDVGFDRSIDDSSCARIHRRAAELFPAIEGSSSSRKWFGFRPQSQYGSAPHMEQIPGTNVWLAYGHYRNGILLTPLTATRIASEIMGH